VTDQQIQTVAWCIGAFLLGVGLGLFKRVLDKLGDDE
jgi:hypothetical protein